MLINLRALWAVYVCLWPAARDVTCRHASRSAHFVSALCLLQDASALTVCILNNLYAAANAASHTYVSPTSHRPPCPPWQS